MRFSFLSVLVLSSVMLACATRSPAPVPSGGAPVEGPSPLDPAAEQYVKLVLALGQHGESDVDAYYGPEAWAREARTTRLSLVEIGQRTAAVMKAVEAVPVPGDALVAMRRRFLLAQLSALSTRVRMLSGERLTFDDESQALYGARAPRHSKAEFEAVLARLDELVPGPGSLSERVDRFRQRFVIPLDKREAVYRAAIAEARRRTLLHGVLPDHERFTLEFVSGKSWGAYNWFQGNATSLIQINTELPDFIGRVVLLAAHEGYPGHHVYSSLLEQHLVRERGWVEFTVYPLFSPMSFIAEGSADYGVELAFPDAEAYVRDVLFPLAGFDPKDAAPYMRLEALLTQLSYATTEAARAWLDGRLDREATRDWLMRYAMMSPARAELTMKNTEANRSYVINYNLGRDLVRQYVERRAGPGATQERRWEVFLELLASPRLPADLQ
ncbi:hypothetical protein JY651_17645 [Pyxidicoccus parkwayensis]|uniref:DUF885 domain-containing protein n=1 Tax=Pyxidicoccus parkwayensis TaxID=2813578 RepID=A0ABX7P870_9BACT|nr:hypothetical protein [Pyxidicoccus parkwaysis]QSQ26639.1 hypothetical protein JY651_17645 [Pyxidicoccus parkwaysis]